MFEKNRRTLRLKGYDYTQPGGYFVTICTQNRECLFGDVVNGEMALNDTGKMINKWWGKLPQKFTHVEIDEYMIMPNHFHGIVIINRRGESCIRPINSSHENIRSIEGDHEDRPYGTIDGSIGRIIQAFKSTTTHQYIAGVKKFGWHPFPGRLWQRNYHEHIIRNEPDLNRIREYIVNNPLKWDEDEENPEKI